MTKHHNTSLRKIFASIGWWILSLNPIGANIIHRGVFMTLLLEKQLHFQTLSFLSFDVSNIPKIGDDQKFMSINENVLEIRR